MGNLSSLRFSGLELVGLFLLPHLRSFQSLFLKNFLHWIFSSAPQALIAWVLDILILFYMSLRLYLLFSPLIFTLVVLIGQFRIGWFLTHWIIFSINLNFSSSYWICIQIHWLFGHLHSAIGSSIEVFFFNFDYFISSSKISIWSFFT